MRDFSFGTLFLPAAVFIRVKPSLFLPALFGIFVAAVPAFASAQTDAPASPSSPSPARAANYLSDLQNTHKWRKLPVHVFFQTGGSYSPSYEQAARAGFNEWARATDGVVGYVVVPVQKQADVIVRFIPGSFVPPDPNAVGETSYSTHGPYMYKALMTLATGGTNASPAELSEVAAHEWGHALGIHGHSKTPSDIMYGVTTRYVSLDPDFVPPAPRTVGGRDAATLKALYAPLFKR